MFQNSKKKKKEEFSESFGKGKTDSFNFELIEKYFRKKDKADSFQCLSDKTCNDLDFLELFMFADRTVSKVGQQYLYNTLRTIPANGDKINEQEKLIDRISTDSVLRMKLQFLLDRLAGENAYFITSLFQDEHLKEPKWFFIIRLLSFTAILSVIMLPFIPQAIFILLPVIILNFGVHYWNKKNLNEYLGSVPQLLKLNEVAKELIKIDIFKTVDKDITEAIKTIDKVRNRLQFFKLEAKFEGDMQIAFWASVELIKSLFLIEPQLLFGALKLLDTRRKEIENVFSFVGYIDSLISIASLRHGLEVYCVPQIKSQGKVLEATDIYHPMIINCIPNSLKVNGKSILITGSNMSGKTSFIRTIAINAITGLTINTCFAKQFSLSRFHIQSAIRLSDDLMNDKSYYFEEVLTIKEMVVDSQKNVSNLFLLDEIFKGTNTIERISAGKAVLSYLDNDQNLVFVSTHDIELTEMLQDSYELYHFSEQVDNKTVDFDFKLKEGKLKNRNAIKILEINDYPKEIIDEAIELSKELDKFSIANKI